jgi:diguanylate cyclase (GGDEF)-like protein
MEMWDQMTGTLSSDFFRFLLGSEGKRAMRYSYYFSILTVEIDQAENTKLLATLARLIRQSVRNTDYIGRTNHQQLSVVLHHAEIPHTYSVGERIREQAEDYNFVHPNEQCNRTVSIGGACFPSHTSDVQSLLWIAGEMLLEAQSVGGNKVYIPKTRIR